jgi:hypothetical protein
MGYSVGVIRRALRLVSTQTQSTKVSKMILREWRAEIRRDLRDEYVAYVYLTGIETYRKTPGNLFALAATRTSTTRVRKS